MYEIIGVWCVVLLTLSIFSYLYGDNPFYKAAEHIFVGVSAGYVFTITFWDTIWPNLFGRLFPSSIMYSYFCIQSCFNRFGASIGSMLQSVRCFNLFGDSIGSVLELVRCFIWFRCYG